MSIYEHFSVKEIEILRERAKRVAQDNSTQDAQAFVAALIISIRGEVYGLPVEQILTIYEDVPIVPVPSVPNYIRGIANLRGHITPIVDLGILLDVPDDNIEIEKHYLIVISDRDRRVALFVEQVGDIIEFINEDILPLTTESDHKSPFIKGIAPSGETLINSLEIFNQGISN